MDKAVANLKDRMAENKFYPFEQQQNGTLKFTVRSSAFWPAVALLVASSITSVYLIISAEFSHSTIFG
jgi:hypothetical protein